MNMLRPVTSNRKRCDLPGSCIHAIVNSIGRRLRDRCTIDLVIPPYSADIVLLRKEVIQPQVPLRLPCYDFIPITTHTLGTFLPCGLDQRLRVQTAFMM